MSLFPFVMQAIPVLVLAFALIALVLSRRGTGLALLAVWVLAMLGGVLGPTAWVGFPAPPGYVLWPRLLLAFFLVPGLPVTASAAVAHLLGRRPPRLAMHAAAVVGCTLVAYVAGALAASHVIDVVIAVQ